jgi:hypothetical protein
MLPFLSYHSATMIMYALGHKKYTGWSRLQSMFCIPFLFTSYSNVATELIWLNSFGCALSVHLFYAVTHYEVLHLLASRSLSSSSYYQKTRYKKLCHFIADAILHGTPCLLCLGLSRERQPYVWIVPALTHVSYPYIMIGTWNPSSLYGVDDYPKWKYRLCWIGTFFIYVFL